MFWIAWTRVGNLGGLVAGAGKTADQPVADQLVVAGALDLDQVLEPVGARRAAATAANDSEQRETG